ncbi:hypothetical protein E6C50_02765 [Flavobacterium supellecticarium]|uniref:Uncharacterized protein n=1 Tax=Flavobacterium supellecticarium TaxID=2565924 RepID=A0A4S4A3W6_9FLAO|nr:hypothetical protein [Flavobacterium supellecticarium]THF53144.1 hypothetical protein E6C50_02765 [Flavobacterium supellecticarium]
MTKLLLPIIFLSFSLTNLFGQNKESKDPIIDDKGQISRFYYFEIPSAINGSNLDPSAISNVTANFTDSKISLKLGFPSLFKDVPSTRNLKNSGFVQANFKASNGITTLYKSGNPPLEYGLTAGFSRVIRHTYWTYTDTATYGKNAHSSEGMTWINIIGNLEQVNYNIFTPSGQYGNLITKLNGQLGGLYISLNRYFHSDISEHKWKRCIASIGVGYAKTNNYSSLKKRTLEDGKLIHNKDSTAYQTVVETTSGAIGNLITVEGLTSFGELFIPLIKSKKYGSLYLGSRLTYYGIGNDNYIINGNTGFYVNLKDKKLDKDNLDKPAKDIISFSVTGQFNQLNKSKETDYFNNNFSVVLQLAVPIRFN